MLGFLKARWHARRLASPESWERQLAVEGLSGCGAAALPALVELLGRETHRLVLMDAARALGRLGDPRAVPALAKLLEHSDHEVAKVAAEALGAIGAPACADPILAALGRIDYVGMAAARAAGRLKDPRALEPLLRNLRRPGDTAFDGYIRSAAAVGLGRLGRPEAVEPLCAALRDPDYLVQTDAALALEALGARPADPELERHWRGRLLGSRKDIAGLLALGPAGVEPLIELARGAEPPLRAQAADALGAAGDRRAVRALCFALSDGYYEVNAAAARSLGMLGDAAAIGPLREFLARTDPNRPRTRSVWAQAEFDPRVDGPRRDAARHAASNALALLGG